MLPLRRGHLDTIFFLFLFLLNGAWISLAGRNYMADVITRLFFSICTQVKKENWGGETKTPQNKAAMRDILLQEGFGVEFVSEREFNSLMTKAINEKAVKTRKRKRNKCEKR